MKVEVAAEAAARRTRPLVLAAGGALLAGAVALIYRDAALAYFFNDDFQWLQGARDFAFGNVLHLERYSHFYRPVIEIYFYAGRALFGCNALPFHVASIAIHLVNTVLLFLLARALARSDAFAGLAAVFFAVQPGHAEAVAWVGAITDLLPATWYLLAMWTWLRFLQTNRARFYAVSLVAFVLCLLTHEISATLLPMMVALHVTVRSPESDVRRPESWLRYLPFALLLAGSLLIAYVVNSRSYLVREGHYRIGWHAVPHALDYLITLYVGTRGLASQLLTAAAIAALLARGSPRVRFFTLWVIVTIAPASFFTWGNVSRYLYLPAAGFALLLAAGVLALRRLCERYMSPRAARAIAVVVTLVLAVRFATFAAKVPAGFREWTAPYARFVRAVRKATAAAPGAAVVAVDPADLEGVQPQFRDPAAEIASCGPDLHVVAR